MCVPSENMTDNKETQASDETRIRHALTKLQIKKTIQNQREVLKYHQ